MHRSLKTGLTLLVALPLLAGGLLLGLAGSDSGTRVLAEQLRRWSAGAVDFADLQGRLLGPLRLEDLQVRVPGLTLEVRTLALDWSPGALLSGRLEVARLAASGIRASLAEVGEAPAAESGAGPGLRPQDWPLPIDIGVDSLELLDVQWRSGAGPAQAIERISLSARLEDRQLALAGLEVRAAQGFAEASGEVGFNRQLPLRLDLRWQWRLADQRLLGGALSARGDAGELSLQHSGSGELPLGLRGTVRDLLGAPGWELRVDWPELPLAGGASPLLVGPGWLHSEGTLDAYRLDSEGRLRGAGPDPLSWSLRAQGTPSGLHLAPLVLGSTPGELELRGAIDWTGPLSAALDYRVAGEELGRYHPDLPPRLDAHGQLQGSYQSDAVVLQTFDLAVDQAPLQLSLEGRVTLSDPGGPGLDLELAWRQLNWPPAADAPALASPAGRLHVAGTVDDYRLELGAELTGSDLPPGHWQARATGSRARLQLEYLTGQLLSGVLTLAGELDWELDPRWDLELNGSELDPGQWWPDLPGRLALALRSAGHIDPADGPQGRVELEQLSGELAGRDLRLVARALLAGDTLDLQQLRLDSGANRLGAAGRLSPGELALEWNLQLPAPGTLLPGLRGDLAGDGRLVGTAGAPRLRARWSGWALQFDTHSLSALDVELEAGPAPDAPLQLDVTLGDLARGDELLLRSARVLARGSTAAHRLEMEVDAPAQQLRATLQGGLHAGAGQWRGTLTELVAQTAEYGAWRLAQAAPLALGAGALSLGEACLRSDDAAARLCVAAERAGSGGTRLAARVEALPLQRFVANLSGQVDGRLQGSLAADGALRGEGEFELGAGQLRATDEEGAQTIAHRGGKLELTITEGGLEAGMQLRGERQHLLLADLQLPGLNRLPLSAPQPLAGRIEGGLDDLSGLQTLVSALGPTTGSLRLDLQLAGTLQQPLVQGELVLAGAADLPLAGLQLRDIELRVDSDPARPGQLDVAGGLASGPGRVDFSGGIDLTARGLALDLSGDRLLAYNTPDARVLLSPDLQLGWDGEVLRLRGRVEVPQADITPQLGLSPAALTEGSGAAAPGGVITPSADVVVVGAAGEVGKPPATPPPLLLDSQLQLVLGEKVKVSALGLTGRLTGDVTFTNRPGADLLPLARGRLSIEDGTFRAFGQDLDIETGRVIFARTPVTEPELVVRAVRWIDNDPLVSAVGVLVSGPADQPLLELFSRPQLDQTEIQSYLLTGSGSGNRDSVLSIGTYLYPKLYVSYGYNLLEETNQFDTLYTITPRYGVETKVGEADNTLNMTITYEH